MYYRISSLLLTLRRLQFFRRSDNLLAMSATLGGFFEHSAIVHGSLGKWSILPVIEGGSTNDASKNT